MASEASLARLVFILKDGQRESVTNQVVAEPGDGSVRDFRGGGGDDRAAV